jgi:DNA-binding NarL/FixJ family response regulator
MLTMTAGPDSGVPTGFEALATGEWSAARDAFEAVLLSGDAPEPLMGLANASYWLGDLDVMLDSLERAYASACRTGASMFAAAAAMSLVGYHKQFVGNMAAARGWLARAARIVDSEVPELRGELLGATAFVTDDPAEGERLAREAQEIGRANGNVDLELLAMTATGAALVQQGRTAEGMALLDEAMAAALGGACGDPLTAAHASCMTIVVCASHFDIERATQWLRAMDRFIARYGCPFLDAECRTHYGRVLFESGNWGAAEETLSNAIAMAKGTTPSSFAAASATMAELRIAQGRLEDAERLLRGLEGRDETTGAVALLRVRRGQTEAAAALLSHAIGTLEVPRLDVAPLIELLGRCQIASGDRPGATARAVTLIELGDRNDCPVIAAHGHRLLGHAVASVDARRTADELQRAVAAFTRAGMPYRAAETRLELAGELATSERQVAAVEAGHALEVFEDLGAGGRADEAAALLRTLGVRAARTGPKNIGRLTKREQEVLTLVSAGLSNPEIADRLFVSRKTVEHHVASVLAKLGVRSRAEAAAVAERLRHTRESSK